MNLRLKLTKSLHNGRSDLIDAIDNGVQRYSFFENILKEYRDEIRTKPTVQQAYTAFFNRY